MGAEGLFGEGGANGAAGSPPLLPASWSRLPPTPSSPAGHPTTPGFKALLARILADRERLIKGPYVSVALPFQQGSRRDWFPQIPLPFPANRHQEQAFEWLLPGTPRPTLVDTGTGSGKLSFSCCRFSCTAASNRQEVKLVPATGERSRIRGDHTPSSGEYWGVDGALLSRASHDRGWLAVLDLRKLIDFRLEPMQTIILSSLDIPCPEKINISQINYYVYLYSVGLIRFEFS
jgi:hypothetical protein